MAVVRAAILHVFFSTCRVLAIHFGGMTHESHVARAMLHRVALGDLIAASVPILLTTIPAGTFQFLSLELHDVSLWTRHRCAPPFHSTAIGHGRLRTIGVFAQNVTRIVF
jgi:hypothetical protein